MPPVPPDHISPEVAAYYLPQVGMLALSIIRDEAAAQTHALLQSAAGQPSSREAAAERWETWAASNAAAREASQQAAVPAQANLGREAKG